MARGRSKPSIDRAKNVNRANPLAGEIRDGLTPYLSGMLKTIGQAGAGKQSRGKGDLRAAVSGVKLLIDAIERSSGDSEILDLIKQVRSKMPDGEEWDETAFVDDEADEDLENLNKEIDEF
jgi:hypothetical protein